VAHDDWTHFVVFGPCKIFCFFKQVRTKNFVSENSLWRDYFKKQKILQGPKLLIIIKIKDGVDDECGRK